MNNLQELSKSLHEAFCKELNDAWLEAVENNSGTTFSVKKLDHIRLLIQDAQKTGYQFQYHHESTFFLDKCLTKEGQLSNHDNWSEITQINNFIQYCTDEGWEHVKTKLIQLKDRKLIVASENLAIELVKKRGPFYTGQDLTNIYVFGLTGDSAQEMALISLLYGYLEKVK